MALKRKVVRRLSLLSIAFFFWILLAGEKSSPDSITVKEREAPALALNSNDRYPESDEEREPEPATLKIQLAILEMERIRLKMALSESQSMKVIFGPAKSRRCQRSGSGLFLLVLVVSSPENVARREAIRSSWRKMEVGWEQRFFEDLKNQNRSVKSSIELPVFTRAMQLLFYVGQPAKNVSMDILSEWRQHGDLVIDDLKESYLTLTMKTLRMIRWALENCPGAKYLMKMDDDVFIHVPKYLRYLLNQNGNTSFVAGSLVPKVQRKPHYEPNSKWFSPTAVYSKELFPAFLRGIVYVMGMEAARKIWKLEKSRRLPLFHLEDVFITGIMANEELSLELKNIEPNEPFFHYLSPKLVRSLTLVKKLNNFFIRNASPSQIKCWTSLTLENEKELEDINKRPGFVPCDKT